MRSKTPVVAAIGLALALSAGVSLGATPATAAANTDEPSSASTPPPSRLVREHFRLADRLGARIAPNATNYAARTEPDAPLLLFLPATSEQPSDYTSFLGVAREKGFHVLALDYWNDGRSVQDTCGTDATCYADVQRNRLDGSHPDRFSSVDRANSIDNRFRLAIQHLESIDPEGGWGKFVGHDGIDWNDVVVAGHSQGGGESAYISHFHRVLGVIMFSSPVDSDNGVTASWIRSPGKTPPSRMYGFDDVGDEFGSRIMASWNALGLSRFGGPENTDGGIPGGSHELISTVNLGNARQAHLLDITDHSPLTASGRPLFESVWKWMLDRVWSAKPIASA